MIIQPTARRLSTLSALLGNPIAWFKARPLLVSSLLFFASTTLVNLGNYVFNLMLGRQLGPSMFADLSLIVTFMLVLTFATTTITTTTARFAATYSSSDDMHQLAALRSWLQRWVLLIGILLLLSLVLGAAPLATLFHMHSSLPFIILGVGMPIFFLLAVDRGILQGCARFGQLSWSNQAEMWMRLLGALFFVALGLSVIGATWALTLSFGVAWLVALSARKGLPKAVTPLSAIERSKITRYFGPVVIGLIGQIIINNSDVLIVKSYYAANPAGLYAALALIGRMVFFATWSIVMVMFPLAAKKHQQGESSRSLLWLSVAVIAIISTLIIVATALFPEPVVNILFGHAYLPIAPLLWLYALATAFYALANVVATYHLSLGNGRGNLFVLLAGIAQIVGLLLFHQTLFTVVLVQVCIMAALFCGLLVWDRIGAN